jgi:hypothetical protein
MLQAYVFKYFSCFRDMLQVFHLDVAKLDQDVAYVAMVVHVYCKLLFQRFICFFRRMLQVCLSRCCICFHTYVTNILSGCCIWFAMVFKCFSCVTAFRWAKRLKTFCAVPVTSNLWTHTWSIKCR